MTWSSSASIYEEADMARASEEAAPADTTPAADVSEASATSNQANPMDEAPAEPTDAQAAAAGETPPGPSKESLDAAKEDREKRAEDPNKPVMREAREGVGGESFDYLDHVSA